MPENPIELAVLLPIHNEAGHIRQLVERILRCAEELGVAGTAVLLIDDGSDDGSAQEIAELTAQLRDCSGVRHERNLGYGAAVRSGLAALEQIRPQWVMLMDADGTMDPAGICGFREKIRAGADLAIGCRYGDDRPRDYPLWRLLISWTGSLICRAAFGLRLRDFTLGMRAFNYDSSRRWRLTSSSFALLLQMVQEALRNDASLANVAISYMGRSGGASKFRYNPRLVAEYLRYAWRAWRWRTARR